ncbi:MAG: DMT family transporter [Prevotella sp.]|jgi:drug/metabolite transporter (DMT)-like permease
MQGTVNHSSGFATNTTGNSSSGSGRGVPPLNNWPGGISNETKGLLALHGSVLLAGFTGLFGKLITLHETSLVWWRMFFTVAILFVFTGLPRVSLRKLLQMAGTGTLLGLHWMLFYGSIKLSNVSIGVVCFATIGFFTAIFEPLLLHRRFSWVELMFALITVLGLVCIFSFDSRYRLGITVGIVSAAVCSLYTICNKQTSRNERTRVVLFYQMAGGLVGVTLLLPLYRLVFPEDTTFVQVPVGSDLWWLLAHALFCTVGLYLLQIMALKQLSAFTVNLTYNLEPCYTIILAFIFFGEGREVNFSFYIGISLVICSVLLQTLRQLRHRH